MLGFFAFTWLALLAILGADPDIYLRALTKSTGARGPFAIAFFGALTALIALVCIGVVRRWRWTYWLIVAAFLAGILRVPAFLLQITGLLAGAGPTWYLALQAAIGAAQFVIAVLLLRGYRRSGPWGAF